MKNTSINQEVNITAVGFGKNLSTYPRQMEFEGNTYNFIDKGLSCRVQKGDQTTHILTLSDGHHQFWLRNGGRGIWTLLSMS